MYSTEQLYVSMAEVIAVAMDDLMVGINADEMADKVAYEVVDQVAD